MSTPWMPLYISDYLADTSHLSTLEHGAYLLLIMHYWRNAGLPDDEKKLARICRMTSRQWDAARDTLAEFFGDGWAHHRIDKELSRAADKSERRAASGSRGGLAKSLKNKEASVANATNLPEQNDSNALASSSQPQPDKKEKSTSYSRQSDDESLEQALEGYNRIASSVGWPQVQKMTDSRRAHLRSRLKDAGGLSGWLEALERGSRSSFLTGSTGWRADFDFFLQPKSFNKLLEGSYDDKKPPIASNGTNTGRPDAGSVLSAGLRRLARLDQRERGATSGDFDFGRDEEADDRSSRSPLGNHGRQASSGRDEGSDGFALFLPSTGRQ